MDPTNPPSGVNPLSASSAHAEVSAGRLSPQQKKQLSYDKDRRNTYGENDKASRKAIPRNKRRVNRANRHRERQMIAESTASHGAGDDDAADDRLHARRPKRWRKSPDETLRQVVERKIRRRAQAKRHSAE